MARFDSPARVGDARDRSTTPAGRGDLPRRLRAPDHARGPARDAPSHERARCQADADAERYHPGGDAARGARADQP